MSLTAIAFVLFFACAMCMAIMVRPIYGLYAYIGVFYLHPPSRWWGADLPDLRWSLIAAGITLFAAVIRRPAYRESFRLPPYSSTTAVVLVVYALWMWLQVPWVYSPWQVDGAVLFTKYAVLLVLMYTLIDDTEKMGNFCLVNTLGCAYLGWLVYLAPDAGRLEGVGGPGIDNANTLGMHLSASLMYAGFYLVVSKGWKRWATVLSIPLILNGAIQTETRGAIVGILIGALVTVYLKPKVFSRRYWALIALAGVGVIAIANDAFLNRMQTFQAQISEDAAWDNSASSRLDIAKAQFRIFTDYPFGAGHQGTAALSVAYMDENLLAGDSGDRASHNTVMSILVDQGIVGIILFGVLAISIFRQLRRLKKMDKHNLDPTLGIYRAMLGGVLATILGSGMFAQYLKAEIMYWSLAMLAVLWAHCVSNQQATNVPAESAGAPGQAAT